VVWHCLYSGMNMLNPADSTEKFLTVIGNFAIFTLVMWSRRRLRWGLKKTRRSHGSGLDWPNGFT
jgi:hypothetical protein